MVYQDLALIDAADIATNLTLGREPLTRGPLGWLGFLDKKAMRQEAERELRALGVTTAPPGRVVEMLSGGQRQVVALARSAVRVDRPRPRRVAARRADRRARVRTVAAGRRR